ncbi:MAG: A/G-specific adenine glycosylase [Ferruginibacter sp.]
MKTTEKKYFVQQLEKWNRDSNKRAMPWKGEKDPYKIWLSEIILQQTRVEQGLDYYNRFVKTFPDVKQLANAPETKVFKLWEGLGYYTRCKNLIAAAKYIANDLKGKFPSSYEDILSLKGVGPYTAAAIGSFAFNLPHAVVDGNVFRVLSRFFGIDIPIDSIEGKKLFTQLANELLDKQQPGIYNQALMDFGAVICKPQLPLCNNCVLQNKCYAFNNNIVAKLPVKEKSIIKKTRWFYYVVGKYKGKTYVKKRGAGDIWENLYEFILTESKSELELTDLKRQPVLKQLLDPKNAEISVVSKIYRQVLTHQVIIGRFITAEFSKPAPLKGYELVNIEQMEHLPFPKFISNYLKDKDVSLNLL